MLLHLSVRDFAIADHIELEFDNGMTVITGETGAGKSIMLDALSLCLGARADANVVRHGCKQADITAHFDVRNIDAAQAWLAQRALNNDEHECLMRRVVTAEGRSRGFINGSNVNASDLKELGELLIDIHSQHEHQTLLKKQNHRTILDSFGGHLDLAENVTIAAKRYHEVSSNLIARLANQEEYTAKVQLLSYQVDELDKLALRDGEIDELENEIKQLSNAEDILRNNQKALNLCQNDEGQGALDKLNQAFRVIQDNLDSDITLNDVADMLESARIQIDEASRELQHRVDNFDLDPERLNQLETRYDDIMSVARRHRVDASELNTLFANLSAELADLNNDGSSIEELEQLQESALKHYKTLAKQLSTSRQSCAESLQSQVNAQLQQLSMKGCRFEVNLSPWQDNVHKLGDEEIEFLIATQPNKPAQPLGKIASGGELSRISLAIQVITAQTSAVGCMVFDEVDVGIGGAVAEVVGNLLQDLSKNTQVLCVTHLAQVAVKGHQHILVSKQHTEDSVSTNLEQLEPDDKIMEIARMIGGISVNEQTMAHAKAMLNVAH